jgi:hypothetical protein
MQVIDGVIKIEAVDVKRGPPQILRTKKGLHRKPRRVGLAKMMHGELKDSPRG